MILPIRTSFRRLFTGSRVAFTDYRDVLEKSRDLLTEKFKLGSNVDLIEANDLIKELAKTGYLNDARYLFDIMPQRNEISWTRMISAYVNASNASEALALFSQMWIDSTIQMDPFVLSVALKACGDHSESKQGESIHGYSVKTGFVNSVFVGSALLDMYAKTGSIPMAHRMFDEMPNKNVVAWTAIIAGLVRAGHAKEALKYFSRMRRSDVECDSYTFASVLKACADLGALKCGKEIHTQAMKFGIDASSFVANTLATMYNKCGKLDYGLLLFERMRVRDVVSWTTVIATYVQMGLEEKAIQVFVHMRESGTSPNDFTYAAVISGCTSLAKIEWGEQLHAHILSIGLAGSMSVANSIMTMYSKCGCLISASMVFLDMNKRDTVSWSAIIAGYSQEGRSEEAFDLFSQMRREGTQPNEFTLASLLSVCAFTAILEQGKQIHAYVLSAGLELDPMVNSAMISMYSKCGSIEEALRIFGEMGEQNVVSWTAMINGYAEHGYSKESLDLFEKMTLLGLKPDYVTFIGVLSACSHAGLVDLCFHYFDLMSKEYRINPTKEHYGCMVDLLCRVGRVSAAERMIETMPFKPDDVFLSTLLRACRIHGDVECGKRTAEHMFELHPNCAGAHITLSNIYSAIGRWEDAAEVRKLMKSKGVRKEPGWSWIKVKERVSAFMAGDRSHPQGERIYTMLDLLASSAKEAGYDPELSYLLCDLED